MLIVQIYVDDIIFGATNEELCQEFSKLMQGEFEMSMMGELKSNKKKNEHSSLRQSTAKSF